MREQAEIKGIHSLDIIVIDINTIHTMYVQGVQEKLCFFLQFTATPPSLQETLEAFKGMRVYSHSYWLVVFLYKQ